MAYDERLAERVRRLLSRRQGLTERKMFGGLAFLLHGTMCCGIIKNELMVRVGVDGYDEALALPGARPMDFTGRPMRGMVYVGARALRNDDALRAWVKRGAQHAASLPRKTAAPARRKR